jgi:hypothetical protein
MPENDTPGVETTTTTPPAATSTPPAPETGPDGKPFDAARAMTTIEALRAEIKGLKGTQKERDDLATRLREIEDKDKSEAERASGKAAEAEKKLSETESRLRNMAIRVAVAESATAAGIAPENVKAALRLLDADAIELDEDGEPKNVEAVLKGLVKEFPILAGEQANGATAKRGVPPTPKPSGQQPTRDERVAQTQKELARSGRYAPL